MNLEIVKINDLKPLKENVRKHNDIQIDEMIRSVKQFGQTRAIVIDEDNNILIGNGLYYAMVKMGLDEAQCFRKVDLTEVQKKKLVLTDNKVYSLGRDDYDGINKFVNDITSTGDFDIAGFDTYSLEMMTMSFDEVEEDMKEYGVVTDEKYTKPQEVVEPTKSYTQTTPVTTQSVSQVQAHVEKYAPQRKSIVCPCCGEVIYLD